MGGRAEDGATVALMVSMSNNHMQQTESTEAWRAERRQTSWYQVLSRTDTDGLWGEQEWHVMTQEGYLQ